MATPPPPSQWTRIQVVPASQHPEEMARLKELRAQARTRWEEAVASAPQVRAYKARIEQEWLPSMERDLAAARAAVQAATDRLMLRVVAEQGYQVLEPSGQPGQTAVFLSAEDQANDTDLVVANARLKAVTEGLRRLREQLDAVNQQLNIADYQRPPDVG